MKEANLLAMFSPTATRAKRNIPLVVLCEATTLLLLFFGVQALTTYLSAIGGMFGISQGMATAIGLLVAIIWETSLIFTSRALVYDLVLQKTIYTPIAILFAVFALGKIGISLQAASHRAGAAQETADARADSIAAAAATQKMALAATATQAATQAATITDRESRKAAQAANAATKQAAAAATQADSAAAQLAAIESRKAARATAAAESGGLGLVVFDGVAILLSILTAVLKVPKLASSTSPEPIPAAGGQDYIPAADQLNGKRRKRITSRTFGASAASANDTNDDDPEQRKGSISALKMSLNDKAKQLRDEAAMVHPNPEKIKTIWEEYDTIANKILELGGDLPRHTKPLPPRPRQIGFGR